MRHLFAVLLLALACGAAAQPRVSGEQELTSPPLGPAALDQFDAAIASDGDGFLGVWTDAPRGVVAMRFHADGSPLDATPLLVTTVGQGAAVAFGGGRYLVVWMSEPGERAAGPALGRLVVPAAARLPTLHLRRAHRAGPNVRF